MKLSKFLLIAALFLFPASALAQEAASEPGTLTDKIKERLQETAEEGLVAIKEQLTAKANAPRKKAYIGKIVTLDKNEVVLTYKEQNYSVVLTPDTEYFKGANTKIAFDDLDTGKFVIAMGFYSAADDKFTAVRLSVIKDPEPPTNRQLIQGKISEVDGQKVKMNGKTLTLSSKTKLLISGVDEPETDDISLGDELFAVVTMDSNGDVDKVNTVLVQPGRQNPAGLEPTNRPAATKSGNVKE